jgi:hypothetical protein
MRQRVLIRNKQLCSPSRFFLAVDGLNSDKRQPMEELKKPEENPVTPPETLLPRENTKETTSTNTQTNKPETKTQEAQGIWQAGNVTQVLGDWTIVESVNWTHPSYQPRILRRLNTVYLTAIRFYLVSWFCCAVCLPSNGCSL